MNSNNNTAAFIGLGAVGTILAYYGIQYFNEEEEDTTFETDISLNKCEDSLISDKDVSNNLLENKTNKSVNEVEENSNNSIKLEVTEQINNEKNKWSNYWENEYNNQDKSKNDISVE